MGRTLAVATALALLVSPGPAPASQVVAIAVEGGAVAGGSFITGFPGVAPPDVGPFGLVGFQVDQTNGDGLYLGTPGAIFPVAYSGLLAPGGGTLDEIRDGFGINDTGDMAFAATIAGLPGGTSEAIYLARLTLLTEIARTGQLAPGGNGSFDSFFDPRIPPTLGATGLVGFSAHLTGTDQGPVDDLGLFRGGAGGPLVEIVRNGQLAPGGDGAFTGSFGFSMNDAGLFAFRSNLIGATPGSEVGIFLGDGGPLTQFVRWGQAAPDGNGTITQILNPGHIPINSAGQVAAWIGITPTGGGPLEEAIVRGSGGPLTTIVRDGDAAPDGNGIFSGFASGYPLLSMSESGMIGFQANLAATSGGMADDTGMFVGDGLSITQLAREGQTSPDGDGRLAAFIFPPAVTSNGQGAFVGTIDRTTTSDQDALFIADYRELVILATEGELVPGATGRFSGFIFRAQGPDQYAINDHGQVSFFGAQDSGDLGVFIATPDLHWRGAGDGPWGNSDNWTVGLDPAAVHQVFIDPLDTSLVVEGPEQNTTVDRLEVGSLLPGVGFASLEHVHPVEVRAEDEVSISVRGILEMTHAGGALTGDHLSNSGRMLLSNGNGFFNTMTNQGWAEVGGNLFVVGPLENLETGTLNVTSTGELATEVGIVNAGTMNVAADIISPMENLATGLVNFADADSSWFGPMVNNGNLVIDGVNVDFVGLVTNSATGTIKNTGGSVGFQQGFVNSGAYISDPADNEFSDITLDETGYLVGGVGDRFIVFGDFLSSSESSVLWDTLRAELRFEGGGGHTFESTGEDRGEDLALGRRDNFAWGTLALGSGESLALVGGGAIYVTEFLLADGVTQLAALSSDGTSIYYDTRAAANAYLGGQSYALSGGGSLAPAVPEPSSGLLVGLGLVWLARRRGRSGCVKAG